MKHKFIKKRRQTQSGAGFTLIELLVVIAIIGILSAIGLVSLHGAREKAADAKRKNDLASVKTALMLYYDSNKVYPVVDRRTSLSDIDSSLVPAYLSTLPTGSTDQYYYIAGGTFIGGFTQNDAYALLTKLASGNKNWYVINSLGYSGEVAGTSTFLPEGLFWLKLACEFGSPDVSGSFNACEAAPAYVPIT